MKTIPKRICIYPHDIALVTGLTVRQSRNIHSDAKVFYQKTKIHALTVEEFCNYMKIPKESVETFIK